MFFKVLFCYNSSEKDIRSLIFYKELFIKRSQEVRSCTKFILFEKI